MRRTGAAPAGLAQPRYCDSAAESFTDGYERRLWRDLTGGQALSHLQGTRSNAMSTDSTEARQFRFAENQSLFREVNQRVETLTEREATVTEPINFVCECAMTDCSAHIELTDADYEAIRANPRRFFVLPDHVFPEAEEVVGQEEGYVIVEKVGAAGRVAEASAT
jgi:hypothetical protein